MTANQLEFDLAREVRKAGRVLVTRRDFDDDPFQPGQPWVPELEVGVAPFLMVGGPGGGYAGMAPFVVYEIAHHALLRPSVAVGQSLANGLRSNWAAVRLDACARFPGHYTLSEHMGLDVCGGPDFGFFYLAPGTEAGAPPTGKTLPYVSLGPSVGLYAEVGRLAISLRGLAGINVARAEFIDVVGNRAQEPLLTWGVEVALSWSVRSQEIYARFLVNRELSR